MAPAPRAASSSPARRARRSASSGGRTTRCAAPAKTSSSPRSPRGNRYGRITSSSTPGATAQSHSLLDDRAPPRLDIDEVLRRQQAGATLLDTREPADFAAGHLRGAVTVGLQGRFAEYVGSVLAPDREIVLVGDPAAADEGKIRLGRVGYDRVVGQLDDPGSVYAARPDIVETSSRLTVAQLAERQDQAAGLQLVDIRNPGETAAGTIPGAKEIPLAAITDSLATLDADAPVVLYCGSGYRSQIAASVLRAAGFADVSDVVGGFTAWDGAGLPTSAFFVHSSEPVEPRGPGSLAHRRDRHPHGRVLRPQPLPDPVARSGHLASGGRWAGPASWAVRPTGHRGPARVPRGRDARVRRQRPGHVRSADRGRAVETGGGQHGRVDRCPAHRRARLASAQGAVSTSSCAAPTRGTSTGWPNPSGSNAA